MKRMKVVQINAVYDNGGTGHIVQGIQQCARAAGIECIAAYSQGTAKDSKAFHFGGALEQKFHALFSRLFGLQGYFSFWGTHQLLKKLDEVKPDIVHLHNLHSNNIHLNMLLDYLAKHDIVTILTLHDCWLFTGKCCYFTMIQCEKWKKECGGCPNLKEGNRSYFADRTKKVLRDKASRFSKIQHLAVVGVSDWITNLARESPVLCDAELFRTIHNGINTNIFYPRKTDLKQKLGLQDKFVALGVAMEMDKRKGYDDFMELSKILPSDVCLVLVGLSEKQIKTLPDGIVGMKRIMDKDTLTEMYSIADAFVNPTHEEAFGLVNAEALACGTPVITYRTGGCTEIVDESCGLIVECGDVSGMCAAIKKVKNEKPFSSESCTARAQYFNQMDRYHDYVNLYKEMAGNQ